MAKTFVYVLLITLIGNLALSAVALRCHQCNSHINEDCSNLVVNTPRAQRDNQYLKECEQKDSALTFCRKTELKFEVNDERRIERSCGWIEEKIQNACFTADNEGYKQVICTCNEEGCNSAPGWMNHRRQMGFGLAATILSYIFTSLFSH